MKRNIIVLLLVILFICVIKFTYQHIKAFPQPQFLTTSITLNKWQGGYNEDIFIAHGAGGYYNPLVNPHYANMLEADKFVANSITNTDIPLLTYSNSLEALLNSIANGYKFIELDLVVTTDHKIIAAHDWSYFRKSTDAVGANTTYEDLPLSHIDAMSRKIYQHLTVLDGAKIREIFLQHPNLYLVTDKIDDLDLLVSEFAPFLDRVIVEVFSVEKYQEALAKGIKYPALCIWNDKGMWKQAMQQNIQMVTASVKSADKRSTRKRLKKLRRKGVIILGFSTNDDTFMRKNLHLFNLYYTDAWNVKTGTYQYYTE